MSEPLHPIQVAVARTGLSAHVIRIWEKRYGAVTPERTATNRRLYSDEQVSRLILLRRLAEAGHGIGYVAKLSTERLAKLLDEAPSTAVAKADRAPAVETSRDSYLHDALTAVRSLDASKLEAVLQQAELALGAQGVLQRLIAPLVQLMGEQWREGAITAAHEHFASAVIRVFLSQAAKPFAGTETAPIIVVVTPAGQLHELGALLVAALAANLGWRVTYLGAGLAAEDIAGAARQNGAKAVALSIVYPEDDLNLPAELHRLRQHLPETAIVAGGRAMTGYREALDQIEAIQADSLSELGAILDGLRKHRSPSPQATAR